MTSTSLKPLAAAVLLATLWPNSSATADIAVHRRDTFALPNDSAWLYNASGSPNAPLSYSGLAGSPGGYYLQSLDYDATTQRLSGLARAASVGYTARVLTWSSTGTLLSEVPLNGYPTDGFNLGMDMSIHNGVVAVHMRDSLTLPNDSARLYNAATGNQITSLSYFSTAGNPSGYYLQSLDFDAVSGNLYGLVRAAPFGYTARVLRWSNTGALLSDTPLSGYPTDYPDYGADISVNNGVLAIHRRDLLGLSSDSARLYNAATGSQLASLSFSGLAGNPGNYYLQSLDFDATTGYLWGTAYANGLARVLTWTPSGALVSDTALSGYPLSAIGYGMDFAVLTLVPEPSSLALAAFGLAPLAWRRWRRSGRDDPFPAHQPASQPANELAAGAR